MSETRSKFKIRKGDTVVVIAGKDKGKSGKVLSVIEKKPAVVVEKLNIVKRHTKPSQQNRQGGILERESPIHFFQRDAVVSESDLSQARSDRDEVG